MRSKESKATWLERGLSVRQPWAHAIFHRGKDIENRSQRTHYRGLVAIHVSRTVNKAQARNQGLDPDELPVGAVIGYVRLVDCVRNSKWAQKGNWHWVIANPRLLPRPLATKGWLGIFRLKRRIRVMNQR